MKSKLKYILIFTLSIFLVSCAFGRNIQNDPSLKNQLNGKKSEEKSDEEAEKEKNKSLSEKGSEESGGESKEKNPEEADKKFRKDEKSANEKSDEDNNNESNKEPEEKKADDGNKKKIIYLTFDDGPSYKVTNNVLDVLKEHKVKATFFLIGNQIKDREEIVRRIYDEGNAIGLHSYTHNYKKIYSSDDIFIKEMLECRDEISKVIGISPNIIRFPGGSYKHLSKNFLTKLHNEHFKIFDWNLENSDGLKPKTSPDELYAKAIAGNEKKNRIILLLHCTDNNQNTCEALPKIIEYYKSKGYEFKLITEETREIYSPVKG